MSLVLIRRLLFLRLEKVFTQSLSPEIILLTPGKTP